MDNDISLLGWGVYRPFLPEDLSEEAVRRLTDSILEDLRDAQRALSGTDETKKANARRFIESCRLFFVANNARRRHATHEAVG